MGAIFGKEIRIEQKTEQRKIKCMKNNLSSWETGASQRDLQARNMALLHSMNISVASSILYCTASSLTRLAYITTLSLVTFFMPFQIFLSKKTSHTLSFSIVKV